jgi:predicted transcriptional regulator
MPTTIQISEELLNALKRRKLHAKESYEDIIWDLLEDQLFLKDSILKDISKGIKDFEKGTYFTMDEVFGERE